MKKSNDINRIPWWVWICGLSGLLGMGLYKDIVSFNVKNTEFIGI